MFIVMPFNMDVIFDKGDHLSCAKRTFGCDDSDKVWAICTKPFVGDGLARPDLCEYRQHA